MKRGEIGRALSRSYAENLKNLLIATTGISFTWHFFRHTHASEAIADGHGLLAIADRLGHASPQTTLDFYKHLSIRASLDSTNNSKNAIFKLKRVDTASQESICFGSFCL